MSHEPLILAADPDPLVLGYVAAALNRGGFRPVPAPTPAEAAAHPDAGRCRAAVVAPPPGADPAAAVQAIRAAAPGVPVVLTVAARLDLDPADLLALPGVAAVLRKPFCPGSLVAAVRAALD